MQNTQENNMKIHEQIKEATHAPIIETVKDYATRNGISRQRAYKKLQGKTIELPVFVEYDGHRIDIGKQLFVKHV